MINYFKASNNLFFPLFVIRASGAGLPASAAEAAAPLRADVFNILLTSTPSLFKNLSSFICLFILTITFFSSDIVDFGTINNDDLL